MGQVTEKNSLKMMRHYDVELEYHNYLLTCQQKMTRINFKPGNHSFYSDEFELMPVLSKEHAGQMVNFLNENRNENVEDWSCDYMDLISPDPFGAKGRENCQFIYDITSNILTGEVDRVITNYFRSEYFVFWSTFARTLPREEAGTSYKWHRDAGPTRHIKIIVYLNSPEEHDGKTEAIKSSVTERIDVEGYGYVPVDQRTDDLRPYFKSADIPYETTLPEVEPGLGLVINPVNVLHRGVHPTFGQRYAMTLCILPSPINWKDAYRRWPYAVQRKCSNLWLDAYRDVLLGKTQINVTPTPSVA